MKKPNTKQNSSKAAAKTTLNSTTVSLKKYYYLFGILTFFLFVNTIGNGYNMDDGLVTRNHKLTSQGISAIGEIFTSSYYDDGVYSYGYRPMVHLSFALEHDLFGEKPGAGHFFNVILFALSVILFFKLLIRWVGEKNALFAGIATLLFAVHPLHTEVVASLKNRDEILAFLFVIWAGLSTHKFLEKGKWISLISVLILFSLAMLSKKSVYPMAILIPVAVILLKELSIRQLVQTAVIFTLPAALIGSDFQIERSFLMTILPITLIAFTYLVKRYFLAEKTELSLRTVTNNWIIPMFFTIIITCASVYTHHFWLMCFTIPFWAWLYKVNFQIGIISMIVLLICVNLQYTENRIPLLILLIGIGYSFFLRYKGAEIKKWGTLAGIVLIYFLIRRHTTFDFLYATGAILFFLLSYKKIWWGFILSIVIAITVFIISQKLNFYAVVIISFSILLLIEKLFRSFPWSATVPILAFSGLITLLSLEEYEFKKNEASATALTQEQSTQNSQVPADSDSFLKEGRTLLYVENTLVAPHTQSEKIATGFSTLGEYLRLHIFPKELSFYYGYAKIKTVDFRHPMVWVSIIVHLLLIFIAVWQLKKRPLIAIGVMWYLLSILLFSNWIELVAGMVGERLAFTASAGFCILITGILFWIKPEFSLKKPGLIGALLGVAVLLIAGRTIVRNKDWKDSLTLMAHDIKHLSNSAQANNLYAMTLMAESVNNKSLSPVQKLEIQRTAISHFDQATTIWPDFYNAYIDKAKATMLTGDYEDGLKALEKAMKTDPENVLSYYVLLEITERNGDFESYLKSAEQLFKITQSDHAYGVVARGHFLLNDFQKSKEVLLEGLEHHPDNEVLKNNLRIVEEKLHPTLR